MNSNSLPLKNCWLSKYVTISLIGLIGTISTIGWVHADQPIMNMMPRWDDGWGIQLRQEYRENSGLFLGRKEVGNGLTEKIHMTHLEGVYTWDRSIRITAKLPIILDAKREMLDSSGNVFTQRDSGLGDLTLALPLKKYFNLDGRSGSWTAAPQLRVPLGSSSGYNVASRAWGGGLGLGYEAESNVIYYGFHLGAWWFEGSKEEQLHASIDLGYNFEIGENNGQLLWETDFKYETDGTFRLSAGPAFYWRWTDVWHTRIEWKHDFIDYQGTLDHGEGDSFILSVGVVF